MNVVHVGLGSPKVLKEYHSQSDLKFVYKPVNMAKIRDFLRRLLQSKPITATPSTVEVGDPELTDADILREYFSPSRGTVDHLAELIQLITTPLNEALRDRLVSKVRDAEPGENATDILVWALTRDTVEPEVNDEGRWTLCIEVDWRASDEIEWQANEILSTLKMEQRWEWGNVGLCPVGLLAFNAWLVPRGYTLMHVDTGNDAYFAFVVLQSEAAKVLSLAQASGVDVESSEAFATNFSESGEPILRSQKVNGVLGQGR
ncbi:hypothetical protein LXM88_01400 [Burkholderia sp. S-53]|nr:hypothetical protein [Burkholderia sp. S-53]UXU85966.1 hypothetical protein LXM88_01400 [Burkholderia sp. S-53]